MAQEKIKVKVLRTTTASGDRIIEGSLVDIEQRDFAILKGLKKVRKAEKNDKNQPVDEGGEKAENSAE